MKAEKYNCRRSSNIFISFLIVPNGVSTEILRVTDSAHNDFWTVRFVSEKFVLIEHLGLVEYLSLIEELDLNEKWGLIKELGLIEQLALLEPLVYSNSWI